MRLIFSAAIAVIAPLHAQTLWINPAIDNQPWTDSSNWSAGVPDASTAGTIGNGGSAKISNVATAGGLAISNGQIYIQKFGSLTTPTLTMSADSSASSALTTEFNSSLNAGAVTITATAGNAANFFSQGALTATSVAVNGTAATFNLGNAGGTISGNLALSNNALLRGKDFSIGGNFTVSGLGRAFTPLPPAGSVDPAAIFTVAGVFDLSSATAMTFEFSYTFPRSFNDGYSFTFLTATGGILGDSSKVRLSSSMDSNFHIVENGNNLTLVYGAVPEPSTLALIGFGLGAVGCWLRRKPLI